MVVDTSDLTDDAAGTGSGKAASIRCATAGNKVVFGGQKQSKIKILLLKITMFGGIGFIFSSL